MVPRFNRRCWKVSVPTTNALKNTYLLKRKQNTGSYIQVDQGNIFVNAYTLEEVSEMFPDAKNIELLGTAVSLEN